MFVNILKKLFGTSNSRILKSYTEKLNLINSIGKDIKILSDVDLKIRSDTLKNNFIFKKNNLDNLLPEAYAIVREVAYRVLGMYHYDVQILGGIALYYNKVVEIGTGEGKTLLATMPAYLNSFTKNSVHIITVNDYLAKRDASWMKPIYDFLGLSVGIVVSGLDNISRKDAYSKNIVYGTNNEFGFDYLRDNMIFFSNEKVQGKLCYAILDEVDSILIDEARTPLIISSSSSDDCNIYLIINKLVNYLVPCKKSTVEGDFFIDEKIKQVHLTDNGFAKLEKLLIKADLLDNFSSLYDPNNIGILHIVYSSLKAYYFFKKNVDYIVKDKKILIIDEHTGRMMHDRRWSDGIHQSLEAKENLPIQSENNILASITFQNYFRLYENISGMTGTAYTEKSEFNDIYNLDVVVIPHNKKNIRLDYSDLIFMTKKSKFVSILKDIYKSYISKQPVLVGTVSIEVSEYLSSLLKKNKIKHNVLNAKYHEKEAQIISEAGKLGAVTIATNMAGRGTDIVLGGSNSSENSLYNEVVSLGGLKIIGTERHESRRIDNQLRGRAGRQGDPGSSQFYLSLEDDLIRIFISDRVASILYKLNVKEDEAIKHDLINKAIENAQRKVESYNFDIRKQLLEFDDVINEQRKVIYERREYLIFSDDVSILIANIIKDVILKVISYNTFKDENNLNSNLYSLIEIFKIEFGVNLDINELSKLNTNSLITEFILNKVLIFYNIKFENKNFNSLCKALFLRVLDIKWKEHLASLEQLKKSIHLRGYANKDPKNEYKIEAFTLFEKMLEDIKYEFVVLLFKFPIEILDGDVFFKEKRERFNFNHSDFNLSNNDLNKTFSKGEKKIGRNDLCFCGSKKKYKHCHGRN